MNYTQYRVPTGTRVFKHQCQLQLAVNADRVPTGTRVFKQPQHPPNLMTICRVPTGTRVFKQQMANHKDNKGKSGTHGYPCV